MIQQMLAIWSLVPLSFLKPARTSGISQFMYCWSLAWRILSITLLACEVKWFIYKIYISNWTVDIQGKDHSIHHFTSHGSYFFDIYWEAWYSSVLQCKFKVLMNKDFPIWLINLILDKQQRMRWMASITDSMDMWKVKVQVTKSSPTLQPHGLHSPWNSPGHNTGKCSLSLLQGIFPTQWSNPGLLHCRQILSFLSHQGSSVYCTYNFYPKSLLLFLPPVSTLSQPSHRLLSPKPGNSLLVSLHLFIHSTDTYTGHCIC